MTAPTARARLLRRLSDETFDVLVVGGGATGAGIARDAALRGLQVALCEHGDFASQTSSRSSKLIHGGLRYVQYGDLRLVFEGLAERRRLMRAAPHLCRPVEFLFPTYRDTAPGLRTLGAGIALYNGLALWRPPARSRRLSAGQLYALAPWLRAAGLEGAQAYVDCQTDDARVVLAAALDAEIAGAAVASRVSIRRLIHDWRGRVRAAEAEDRVSGARFDVRATLVINATGPFSDAFVAKTAFTHRRLRPTLGVHLVFDAARLPHGDRATVLRSPKDGRLVFLLPAGARTLLGTTDTDWQRPHDAGGPPEVGDPIRARRADVTYLLDVANHAYPPSALGFDDVISTFAGLRPLIAAPAAPAHTPSQTSREHEIFIEPNGVLTVAGGKLTTFRKMAEEVVDRAVEVLKDRGHEGQVRPCSTRTRPLPGGEDGPTSLGDLEVAPAVAEHLAATYGSRAPLVAAFMRGRGQGRGREDDAREDRFTPERATTGRFDPAERIDPELPYVWGEILYAAHHERVEDVEDLLARRLPIFRDARDQGLSVAARAAEVAGSALGWSAERRARSVAEYRRAVELSRAWQTDGLR